MSRGFEKVSIEQFAKDVNAVNIKDIQDEYNNIKYPQRATLLSAGYDFYATRDYNVYPGESLVIPTGIKVHMQNDEWLGLYIRSSLGFKYDVRLKNSVAVIDADYIQSKNEGHIKIGIYNAGSKTLVIKKGDAFAQGIFQKYLLIDDDVPVKEKRVGGIGSTNN